LRVVRSRALSGHARALLSALAQAGPDWRHGYDLSRSTGLRSGTLYPLLIRLEGQGYLEAEWQPSAAAGRPPRHAYRLTASGRELARQEAAAAGPARPPQFRGGEALS
jgi:DNA-binding PadR family transcriptional regulator